MKKIAALLFRFGLSGLVIGVGTIAILAAGESTGLALTDLSHAPVKNITGANLKNSLYVTLDNSDLYRSNDDGRTWKMVSDGPNANINAISVHPTNEKLLFAGTAGGTDAAQSSIWYSSDKGENWNPYGFSLPANPQGQLPQINVLTVDPNHPGVLYAGTEGQGLYRFQSNPGGYTRIGGASLQNLYVKDVVTAPDSAVYAVTTEGLVAIEGDTLRKIAGLPDAPVSLTIDPSNPKILYAGTVGYGVYRSDNGGETWQGINSGLGLQPGVILRVPAITVDKDNPNHLALATAYGIGSQLIGDGVYESFDAGKSWTKLGSTQALVSGLTIRENGVFAATAQGLVRYGQPLSHTSPQAVWGRFSSLTDPTGIQLLILVLTVAIAVWMLFSRLNLMNYRTVAGYVTRHK